MVRAELDKLGISHGTIELGEVEIRENLTQDQHEKLKIALTNQGLELMDDKKAILIDKIKSMVDELIQNSDGMSRIVNSEYISEKLNYDYTYITNLFSEVTGSTIEQYIIAQKIERVKELLIYDDLTITEISYRLNYSSVAHLSNQFKKATGLTPTFFRQLKTKKAVLPDHV